jgi:2'-5' RNA ligase
MISFSDRGLVNTDGVDPHITLVAVGAILSEEVEQVFPHRERISVEKDSFQVALITPYI